MPQPNRIFAADHPEEIAEFLFDRDRRVLVFGETGTGKSTLVTGLSRYLDKNGIRQRILLADPGSPRFGVPGAVCMGRVENGAFRLLDIEALCSLNAGRFRLPLMRAVGRLVTAANDPGLLIDGPGLTRGIAAAELLTGMIATANVDTLLLLARKGKPAPLIDECNAAGIEVVAVMASTHARTPGSRQRRFARTALWDAHLSDFVLQRISLTGRPLLGTPPAMDNCQQWCGRQIALVENQRTIAMGEVVAAETGHLTARLPAMELRSGSLLIRDAGRNTMGELVTITPPKRPSINPGIWSLGSTAGPSIVSPGITLHLGKLTATLINGIFGDPLLHLRLPQQKRSLLFDLGDGNRLPARIAHQVSDVFITHAHIDHISGFYWLLRSRIGDFPVCRLHGPVNLSHHINGMIQGIRWDRIGDRGPCFEIVEVDEDQISRLCLQVGQPDAALQENQTPYHGYLLEDPTFTIRAAVLDHGIPVLALAYEETPRCHVNENELRKTGYSPGPWLGKLNGEWPPANMMRPSNFRTVPGSPFPD